jgi:hypothetical protein
VHVEPASYLSPGEHGEADLLEQIRRIVKLTREANAAKPAAAQPREIAKNDSK